MLPKALKKSEMEKEKKVSSFLIQRKNFAANHRENEILSRGFQSFNLH